MLKHFNITVIGKVQGVCFRAYTQTEAQKLGLTGFVRNEPNGNVFIEAEGETEKLQKLVKWCHSGSPRSKVEDVKITEAELKNYPGFTINR